MPLRVVFFGTPGFAVPTLEHLVRSPHPVAGDRQEHFLVGFTPKDPPADVFRFYEAEMARRGWETEPGP